MICVDVGLYDLDCVLMSDVYTAELQRGLGDGFSIPMFYWLADFVEACLSDLENPPAGMVYFYQVIIIGSDGQPIQTCGT